jgi:hypothetical protein
MDGTLLWRSWPVALQADGPTHFLLDSSCRPCTPDGTTQLRNAWAGWWWWCGARVGSVAAAWQVGLLGSTPDAAAKQAYLQRRLGAAAAAAAAGGPSSPGEQEALQVLHSGGLRATGAATAGRRCMIGCVSPLLETECSALELSAGKAGHWAPVCTEIDSLLWTPMLQPQDASM